MPTPTFPFQRQYPGNLAHNQPVSHDAFNYWDQAIAMAAEGARWTDVALMKNINLGVTVTAKGRSLLYDPTTDFFYSFGTTGSPADPTVGRSRMGAKWDTSLTVPAGTNHLTPGLWAASCAASGILLIGGLPNASSAEKYRRSVNGTTWTIQSSSQTNTAGVNCIAHSPALGLFIAGHSDGKVETSPDGVTWTNRTVPNSDVRTDIAVNDGIIVIGTSAGNRVITSANGTSWTERTLTGASSSNTVCWNPVTAKFYAVHNVGTSTIIASADGITWSTTGVFLPSTIQSPIQLRNFGRALVLLAAGTTEAAFGGILAFSVDGAASWTYGEFLGGTGANSFTISAKGQIVVSDNNAVHHASLAGYL